MIPSGYKEDVVYSAVPTDGSGDLSFTRASNGTRINSAGLVEVVAWNLVEQSETFDNAYWTKDTATITANDTTAPNGTATADKILASAGNGNHGVYNATPFVTNFVGEVYTYSVYAKKGNVDYLVLDHFPNYTFTWFNLNTGTVGTVGSGVTATIESVGNGWYRCSCTKAIISTSSNFVGYYLSNANNTSSFNATGNEFIYLWGAQSNYGSTAKPYFPTTDRLNVPRLTYQNGGGGCPSLLLEKQSTNSFLYSEQFDQADWVKVSTTITANTATSPDGTQNADTLNSTTSTQLIYQVSASGTITFSVYAKAGTTTSLQLASTTSFNGRGADFNLSNGTASAVYQIGSGDADINGGTSSIVNVGNGWYRCIISGLVLTASRAITIANNNGNASYIWGAQLE